MATIYGLYVTKINDFYPKTKRELLELGFDYNGRLICHGNVVAAITVMDKLPGPPCSVINLPVNPNTIKKGA